MVVSGTNLLISIITTTTLEHFGAMRVLETKHLHLALLATVLDDAMQCTIRCKANGTSLRQA